MKSPLIPALLIVAVLLALVGGFYIVIEMGDQQITAVNQDLLTLSARLTSLENTLSLLLNTNEELANKLASEEEQRQLLEEQQATLLADVNKQTSNIENENVAAVVGRWKPFVYQLACVFADETREEDGSGSAVVEQHGEILRFITNRHVLEEDNLTIAQCTLSQPKPGKDFKIAISTSTITFSEEDDVDIGFGIITENITAMSNTKRCTNTPDIGDSVVILGYPGIGAEDSITATEGIISGFQDDYYITSAKIDSGNSGGAAIHIKNDCLLGLPTIVAAGRLESLARILPLTP